jgi:hypothetical protein
MSKTPRLSIGMATYDDFHGVFFSVQALRLYQDISDCELIVVDNNPTSADGEAVRGFLENIKGFELPIKYVPFVDSTGTTQTRERLFTEASGDAVLVMDCHVLLQADAIRRLKHFYASADEQMRKNLMTGPLLMDGLNFVQTHFEPEWRDQMWGTWATAWHSPEGGFVVCRQVDGKVQMKPLNTDGPWSPTDIPWANHEARLLEIGYEVYGFNSNAAPLEIPSQGLGLFSSVREHWLGFNPDFRSFGGEECYIHEKYRQAGRTTFCLPFLKWNHRFGRPGGPKYPITVEGKLRNYVIGFQELGLDLGPVHQHFVGEQGISQAVYDYILVDPVSYVPGQIRAADPSLPSLPSATSNFGMPLPVAATSFHELTGFLKEKAPRDLERHADALIALASRCQSVIEISKRRESTAYLAHGLSSKSACEKQSCASEGCSGDCKTVRRFHSFQHEGDSLLGIVADIVDVGNTDRPIEFTFEITDAPDTLPVLPFEPDMMFFDSRHNAARVEAELSTYAGSVKKFIAFHDTTLHGQVGDDNGKGMLYAVREFLTKNPDWFIYWHTNEQYGLTVLSRDESLRPASPIRPWPMMDTEGLPCGCGQSLKASLKLIGIESSENCSCNQKAAQMDIWGPELCRENIETILDWLKEQADGRNMGSLFVRPVVKMMVLRAIKHAEKQIKAGTCY